MKRSNQIILILLLIAIVSSCKKDNPGNIPDSIVQTDNYSSVANFFAVNCPPVQTFTINASGGSFRTPNGTWVTIPASVYFKTESGGAVTGNITIQFKDIYKKSDMFLNNITTNIYGAKPIKSAGMFYIKAMQGSQVLQLIPGYNEKITIWQPSHSYPLDNNMKPYILQKDTVEGWVTPQMQPDTMISNDFLSDSILNYVFSMYQFSSPVDSGSWCNTDDSAYFSAYPQTTLTLTTLNSYSDYNTQVFLFFTNINAMVRFDYWEYTNSFSYKYAPLSLNCTAIAIGVKNGNLYSSFIPITISSNLTVNFSLSQTTTAGFISQLNALN
ncbi:MAG: hypothetical protein ABR968_02365 [Bacteroidales bacterium]|jgi:hypothetical protein